MALRVLILEDDEADAELVAAELDRAGVPADLRRVNTRDGFAAALRDFAPSVVLSDTELAQFNTLSALSLVRTLRPGTPLVVVAHAIDERSAVACIRGGAEDIVPKRDLRRLPTAIQTALHARRGLEKLTPRQLQVFRLVAEGNTTREIARRLRLSVKTVETHRTELMKRLQVHDVVALVRYAVRVGLVTAEG